MLQKPKFGLQKDVSKQWNKSQAQQEGKKKETKGREKEMPRPVNTVVESTPQKTEAASVQHLVLHCTSSICKKLYHFAKVCRNKCLEMLSNWIWKNLH